MDLAVLTAIASSVAGQPAKLSRVGSAVLFRAGDVALRVTGAPFTLDDAKAESQLAAWLNLRGIHSMTVLDLVCVGDVTVTVLPWLDAVRPATMTDAGRVAALVHSCTAPKGFRRFDPLTVTRARIDRFVADRRATAEELSVLHSALGRAELTWATADSDPVGVVHGDLTGENVLVTASGPVLHDFEHSGVGPVLWDLVRPVHGATRFENFDNSHTDDFMAAYVQAGGMLPSDETLRELCFVVDVIGAAWCVAGRAVDPARFGAESLIRMDTLRTGGTSGATWTPR